jgi:hypothetical protein
MYKIIDLQGGELMSNRTFETLDEIRDTLANFHDIDEPLAHKMSLAELCEIGGWDIERDGRPITVSRTGMIAEED